VREHAAEFISKRDNVETNPFNIIITNGAAHRIKRTIEMFVNSRNAGVMIPYPTYPVYTAEVELRQGVIVPCYCDESKDWALSTDEMERSYREATDKGVNVRLFALINPSNPTGAVKTKQELVNIVRFCENKGIAVLADEVYQSNIYDDRYPFNITQESN
jgi:alanine transaminase